MKKLIFIFFTGISLVSCSKKDVTSPGAANQNVFFKNANVEVENLKTSQEESNSVTISFSTVYENNIQRIELMSSVSKYICAIKGVDTHSNSQTLKTYSFQDTNLKGSTMYYMLRFKDNSGNWIYSNYYSITVH